MQSTAKGRPQWGLPFARLTELMHSSTLPASSATPSHKLANSQISPNPPRPSHSRLGCPRRVVQKRGPRQPQRRAAVVRFHPDRPARLIDPATAQALVPRGAEAAQAPLHPCRPAGLFRQSFPIRSCPEPSMTLLAALDWPPARIGSGCPTDPSPRSSQARAHARCLPLSVDRQAPQARMVSQGRQ